MRIRHLVHSCLLVEVGGRRLLVDPGMFSGDAVRALDPGVLAGLDAVVLTHRHPDHVDRGLLDTVLAASPAAVVLAEPGTAEEVAAPAPEDGPTGAGEAVPADRLHALPAGSAHGFPAVPGHDAVRVEAVGGDHAVIHPDIPRVGNCGVVVSSGEGPRLGITGDSLEPVAPFHGIDALAFAVVAPWSRLSETVDFLRAVRPRLALPVHDAVASGGGRAIYVGQAASLAPEGTEVRDWTDPDRVVVLGED